MNQLTIKIKGEVIALGLLPETMKNKNLFFIYRSKKDS